MRRKKPKDENRPLLTIAVYQNGNHVSGVLQQAYNRGLLQADTQERSGQATRTRSRGPHGELGIDAGAHVSFLAKATGRAGYSRERGSADENRQGQRVVSSYEYTEEYYLHVVRRYLQEQDLLRSVASVERQRPGNRRFHRVPRVVQAQPGHAFLDILTPLNY